MLSGDCPDIVYLRLYGMILVKGTFRRDPGKSRFTAKIMSAKNDKATSASICGIAPDRGIQKSWYFEGLGISKILAFPKVLAS